MADPKSSLASFPLNLGMNNVSFDESVQPFGEGAMLVESRNTRLTKAPGIVSKSPGSVTTRTGTPGTSTCYGIVPCGASRSTASFHRPVDGFNRVNLVNDTRMLSGLYAQTQPQSAFRPARVTRAEAEAIPAIYGTPAMAYDTPTGWTYKAYTTADVLGAVCALYVTVTAADGAVVVPPVQIVAFAGRAKNYAQWFGLSAHGANGVVLWYRDNVSNNIFATRLSVGASCALGVTVPVTIYTPLSADAGEIGLAYDTDDSSAAYLITRHNATAASIAYHRVTIPSLAVTTVAAASGGAAGDYLAIAYVYSAGTQYLAIAHTHAAGTTTVRRLDPLTLAATWAGAGPAYYGRPCLAWYAAGGAYVICSVDNAGSTASAANTGSVEFVFLNWTTGASAGSAIPVPWAITAGHAVTQKLAATELLPLFTLAPMYAVDAITTSVNFLEDPSVEVYTPHFLTYLGVVYMFQNMVARFGVDLAMRYSLLTLTAASCTYMQGNDYCCAYLTEVIGYDSGATGFPVRTIAINFGVGQPRYALDSAGTALIAGSLPAIWDGGYINEHSPVRKPKVYVDATGGSGAALASGTYQFSAVVSWRDAQGKLHRSPPAAPITITIAATSPRVYVTHQPSYHDTLNQPRYTVTVYATEVDGVTLYAQPYTQTATPNPYWYEITSVAQPILGAETPALYSDETSATALPSYCLGAVRDLAVISDRGWAVCAEQRARAYYTKPAERGIALEFSPADMSIDFPSSAGDLVAVTSYRDMPLFMTSTGIWSVAGDGPDALLTPPLFSAPQQVSDVPCSSASSVVTCPAGVLFQSGDRYALFAGGQAQIFPNIVAATVVNTAVFRDQHEVVLFLENGTAYVYNYQANAWSIWRGDTLGAGGIVAAAAQESVDGPALLFGTATAVTQRLDPDTVSSTAQIYLETGWCVLGGPQDDNRITNLVMHAKRVGAHALALTIATDYGAAQPVKSMSAAEVLAASVNNSRYDCWAEPKVQVGRAVKLVIAESGATGESWQPVNLTVELQKTPGKLTQSLLKSGRK